ncbi:MAG: sulfite exporter TauE/SafE family protein [Bacteroidetes bacterium]|nr:sulfite exporter TauE/SafE family protein [Bacteroidota bacterium]
MEFIIICITSFGASLLTFFSGFGLGTLLSPVFMLFFPVEIAIALTGIVHLINNIFKIFLVGKSASKKILLYFGITAVAGALMGAWLLTKISHMPVIHSYSIGDHLFQITVLKLVIAALLVIFSLMDVIPYFEKMQFGKKWLVPGGFISGFFGGLSGHQGALRSAFLIKTGISKQAFIGTTCVISTCVDISRLSIYSAEFLKPELLQNIPLIIGAAMAAIAGAILGNKLLKKITITFLQRFVAIMLLVISLCLGAGLI